MEAKRNYIGQAWLVILLSLAFGGALAGVQVTLQGRIDANKLEETLGQVPRLVPGAEAGERQEVAGREVYRALAGGQMVGWVIPASGQGFADRIELLLGVDSGVTRITGLYVLDQKETPGLGNKIAEEDWRRQFVGKPASAALSARTGGGAGGGQIEGITGATGSQVDAITGATISSASVCDIINATLAQMRPALTAASGGR